MAADDINATIVKFGHPDTLIAEYDHWVVLLRPMQVTLGAMVLGAKGPATAFPALDVAAFDELHTVTGAVERTLGQSFSYQKMNYLMLMMVDPHVHFHVLPRYETEKEFDGVAFPDVGWPGPPRLDQAPDLPADRLAALRDHLKAMWPAV